MAKKILSVSLVVASLCLVFAGAVSASTYEGTISTGIQTGADGVVKAMPTASPAAGDYHATQTVTLTASGSTAICYTTGATTPATPVCATSTTCTTGTKYTSAISVTTSTIINSVACYADASTGPMRTSAYTLTCATPTVTNGTVSAYPACTITCNTNYTLSGSTCVSSGAVINPGGGGGGGGSSTQPPQVSNIVETIAATTAKINWTTDKLATSRINYGLTMDYGQVVSSTTLVTAHSLTLTGLLPLTAYHYQIQVADSGGVTGFFTDRTFTTLKSTTPVQGQATVTPSSGGNATSTSAEGSKASFTVPGGAVNADTTATMNAVSVSSSGTGAAPTGSYIAGGYLFNFTATTGGQAITAFSQPVTLVFTYTDAQISGLDESTLKMNYWDSTSSKWVELSTTVNAANNTLTVTTTHVGYFAIMGQKTTTPVTPITPTTGMTQAQLQVLIAQLQAQIAALIAQIQAQGGTTGTVYAGIPSTFSFTKNLSLNMVDIDVRYLQIILNADPATIVAASGVGSSGQETTTFGSLTKAAVIKFQEKYASEVLTPGGLTSGTGLVYSFTRAKLNKMLGH